MNSSLRKIGRLLLVAAISLGVSEAKAQLKVGDQPTNIQPSAILELQSTQQGLLLPRLTSFTAINALTPPDGMIVYLNSGVPATTGLYQRKAGAWEMMASTATALSNWSLNGNALTGTEFLGSTNAQDVIFKANGAEGFRLTSAGNLQVAATTVPTGTAEVQVLVLKADGTILQRTISANAFKTLIGNITLTTNNTFNAAAVTPQADGSNKLDLPVMTGGATQQYGFLTLADWQKLQTLAGNNISVADYVTIAAAATDPKRGAQITFDNTTNKYVLNLIEADVNHAGIVTTLPQTFGGDKTFANNLNVTGNAAVTGNTTITGTTTIAGATTINNTATVANGLTVSAGGANVTGATTINGATTITGNTTFTGNHLQTGNDHITGATTIDGLVTLPNVAATALTSNINVLLSNAGNVEYKTLNSAAFDGAIQHIIDGQVGGTASLAGPDIKFTVDSVGTNFNLAFDATTGANKLTLNIPSASGVAGAEKRGLVTAGAQSFAGNKSFVNGVTVGSVSAPVSTLDVQGSLATKIVSKTSDYTATDFDNTILVKPAANATATITLPAATGLDGRLYTIKKIGGGNGAIVKIASNAIEDGATSYSIYNDWTFVTVQAQGGTWYIVKH